RGEVFSECFRQGFQGLYFRLRRVKGKGDEGGVVNVVGQAEMVEPAHEQSVREMPGRPCSIEVIGSATVFVAEPGVFTENKPADLGCCFLLCLREVGMNFVQYK